MRCNEDQPRERAQSDQARHEKESPNREWARQMRVVCKQQSDQQRHGEYAEPYHRQVPEKCTQTSPIPLWHLNP